MHRSGRGAMRDALLPSLGSMAWRGLAWLGLAGQTMVVRGQEAWQRTLHRIFSPRRGLPIADLCAFGTMRRLAIPAVAGHEYYVFNSCLRTPDGRKCGF